MNTKGETPEPGAGPQSDSRFPAYAASLNLLRRTNRQRIHAISQRRVAQNGALGVLRLMAGYLVLGDLRCI